MPFANIPASLWDEEGFVKLSEKAQVLYLYLVTGPEASSAAAPGLLVTGIQSLAEGRRQSAVDVHATIGELLQDGWVEFDGPHRVIRVPRAPFFCPPGSPNVVRGWWRRFQTLPPSPLRLRQLQPLREVICGSRQWTNVWDETFGNIVSLTTFQQASIGKKADKGAGSQRKDDYIRQESLPEAFPKTPVRDVCELEASGSLPEASRSESGSTSGSESGSGSGSESDPEGGGGEFAIGTNPGTAPNVFQQARALWELQEDLLEALPYDTGPRRLATADDLAVVKAAFRKWTYEQLEHAQRYIAQCAEDDPGAAKWMNRRANWSNQQLEFAVGAPIAQRRSKVSAVRRSFGGSALPP